MIILQSWPNERNLRLHCFSSIYHSPRFIVYTPNYFLAWREFDEMSKEIVLPTPALRLFDETLALESGLFRIIINLFIDQCVQKESDEIIPCDLVPIISFLPPPPLHSPWPISYCIFHLHPYFLSNEHINDPLTSIPASFSLTSSILLHTYSYNIAERT